MAAPSSTLHTLARHLVLALEPLKAGVADLPAFRTLLYRLAWHVDSLPPAYSALATRVDAALTTLEALGDNPSPGQVFDLLTRVKALYDAIKAVQTAPAGVVASEFLPEFGRSLFDLLLADYLSTAFPEVHGALQALDVLRQEYSEETATRPGVLLSRFAWAEIPKILADPASIATRVYGWGTDDVDFHRLAGHLLEIFVSLNWPAYFGRIAPDLGSGFKEVPDDRTLSIDWALKLPFLMDNIGGEEVEVGLALIELPAQEGKPAGLILQPLVPPAVGSAFNLTDDLRLELRTGSNVASTFGVLLRPDDISVKFPLQAGAALPTAGFGVAFKYAPTAPALLLGTPGKTRLEMKGAATTFHLDFKNGQLELQLGSAPEDLKLILNAGDLDGFLGQLLGGGERTLPIVLAGSWSNRTGFNFTGGAGFEVSTHPHLNAGPFRVDRLDLALKSTFSTSQAPDLKAEVGAVISGKLGPVSFVVEGLGVTTAVVFKEGNAGPFDIQAGFKPPTGLGIVVDAGPISGGGFLAFDKDHSRYSGAVELEVFGTTIKAVGFVETRLPGGAPGWSFVILVSTQFSPIQLGLGFTLNGVGGLAALHRGLAAETLQAGLRSGSLGSLLFPEDVVAEAPRIVSDLGRIFPAARDRHVFGPMALIGWGTPTLIRAELGILLELPSPVRLTLLGLITAKLPTEEAAIVELNVAVLGRIDFARKLLSIDASLFDSNVAGFPISGDMAVRLGWGDTPTFIVSLGGVNPHFQPPPDFPTLQRLTIVLGKGDNPRLTCQAYLTLTSNTLQFGVNAELYAAAFGFNIRGWVSFDCLIQLSPFSLLAELSAEVAFRRGSSVLASVHLEASLSGPAPWHVWGKASLSLWLFDVSVSFDVTFGREEPQELPPADPWPLLQAALQDPRNWAPLLPAGAFQTVSLNAVASPTAPVLVDPGAAATLRQTVVPLNRTITRFGAATPAGPDHYTVHSVTLNGHQAPDLAPLTDFFAAAQFEELTDTDRLSRPSFETMDAGLTMAGSMVTSGASVGAGLEYETVILDVPWQPRRVQLYELILSHQLAFLQLGASALAPFKNTGLVKFATLEEAAPLVVLDAELFVISGTADGKAVPGITGPVGKGLACAALSQHLKAHPQDRDLLQVVPQFETSFSVS
ncbi:MAG: DUF6603 domain-containing protein [Verrucomicrobium sp.]